MSSNVDIMAAIVNEIASAKSTDTMYKEAKEGFTQIEKAYFKLRGLKFEGGVQGIFKQLLPRLMTRMGIPGGMGIGALLAGMGANEGGFSETLGNIPLLGPLFGFLGGLF